MPVAITCPSCDAKLKVPDAVAESGKALRCPKCKDALPARGAVAPAKARAAQAAVKTAPPPPAKKAIQPSPKRESALDEAVAESGLFAESRWMVRSKQGLFQMRVRFDIFQVGTKEVIGYVEERNPTWVSLLGAVGSLRRYLPRRYEARDGDDRLLFKMAAPGSGLLDVMLMRRPGKLVVLDAENQPIGTFLLNKKFFGTPSFAVVDADQGPMGDFAFHKADLKGGVPPRMALVTAGGTEWGSVTGEEIAESVDAAKSGKKVTVSFQFLPPPPRLLTSVEPEAGGDALARVMVLAVALKVFGIDSIFKRG